MIEGPSNYRHRYAALRLTPSLSLHRGLDEQLRDAFYFDLPQELFVSHPPPLVQQLRGRIKPCIRYREVVPFLLFSSSFFSIILKRDFIHSKIFSFSFAAVSRTSLNQFFNFYFSFDSGFSFFSDFQNEFSLFPIFQFGIFLSFILMNFFKLNFSNFSKQIFVVDGLGSLLIFFWESHSSPYFSFGQRKPCGHTVNPTSLVVISSSKFTFTSFVFSLPDVVFHFSIFLFFLIICFDFIRDFILYYRSFGHREPCRQTLNLTRLLVSRVQNLHLPALFFPMMDEFSTGSFVEIF
jgi:hypothetical protein